MAEISQAGVRVSDQGGRMVEGRMFLAARRKSSGFYTTNGATPLKMKDV
jgi:hypothetical protein